jgi:5-methyltetrahydropteroyltriglutamate--homocysteine methyltransferase
MINNPKSLDRILTTHVGSLIRPPALVDLLRLKAEGKAVDSAEFAACYHDSVAEVVRRQAEIGVDIVSDGEFGKSISWSRYILERLSGFERRASDQNSVMPASVHGRDRREFAEFYAEYDKSQGVVGMSGWVVTGPIAYTGIDSLKHDIAEFRAALDGVRVAGAFMPAVSPASVAPERKHEYYNNSDDSLAAIADALRVEYQAILDAGLILQIDDSYFASMYDVLSDLAEYRRWAAGQVEVINHALRDLPEDRVRFHVCWGSWNGPHVHDVEFRDIADLILRIRAGAYSIEMANPRHEHEWRVWETIKLPGGKLLLPGVISHATNVVEHPDLVAERIVRLANLVGRENVIASSDCGFAQGPFMRRVHPSIQWAKLRSLVQGAEIASRQLWKSRLSAA